MKGYIIAFLKVLIMAIIIFAVVFGVGYIALNSGAETTITD